VVDRVKRYLIIGLACLIILVEIPFMASIFSDKAALPERHSVPVTYTSADYIKIPDPLLTGGEAGQWDHGGVAAKSLVKVGDTYYLYYQGDDGTGRIKIGLATSVDLLTWTKCTSNPILDVGVDGSWDDNFVGMPSVVYAHGAWEMLYEGNSGLNSQLFKCLCRQNLQIEQLSERCRTIAVFEKP
jgi:hypothetical protein